MVTVEKLKSFCRKMPGRKRKFNRLLLQIYAKLWKRTFKEMRGSKPSREVEVGPAPFSFITKDPLERELWEKMRKGKTATGIKLACKRSRLWNDKERLFIREIYDQAKEIADSWEGRVVRTKAVRGDKNLWERLKRAKTVQQVRNACYSSKWWVKQESRQGKGKAWMRKLTQHPDEFLKAKEDRRYPRSNRSSSDDKKLRYLAHAMAGISCGISYRTAIDWLENRTYHPRLNNPAVRKASPMREENR